MPVYIKFWQTLKYQFHCHASYVQSNSSKVMPHIQFKISFSIYVFALCMLCISRQTVIVKVTFDGFLSFLKSVQEQCPQKKLEK